MEFARRSKPRGITEVELHLLGRMTSLRLAVEAAKARGRMHLAAPWLDPYPADLVVQQMVDLLDDAAIEPAYGGQQQHRHIA